MLKYLAGAAVDGAVAGGRRAHRRRMRRSKKYVFALVPKNTEQPVLRPGPRRLQEGRERSSNGAFECLYIGPGEHGGGDEQVQIVHDLIAKKVDGIAVSPSNAAAMARGAARRPRRPASRC